MISPTEPPAAEWPSRPTRASDEGTTAIAADHWRRILDPQAFYNEKVRPAFRRAGGVVYILPDAKPLEAVFPGVLTRSVAAPDAPSRKPAALPRA